MRKLGNVRAFAILIALSGVFAFQAQAAELKLKCDLATSPKNAGLSKVYYITHKDGAANVLVYDGWIKDFVGEPLLARVTRNDSKSLIFKWELHGVSKTNSQYVNHYRYRGSYLRTTGELDVKMHPGGYDPLPGARGRCRPVK